MIRHIPVEVQDHLARGKHVAAEFAPRGQFVRAHPFDEAGQAEHKALLINAGASQNYAEVFNPDSKEH